jgi:hypothetical protein
MPAPVGGVVLVDDHDRPIFDPKQSDKSVEHCRKQVKMNEIVFLPPKKPDRPNDMRDAIDPRVIPTMNRDSRSLEPVQDGTITEGK